MHNEPSRIPAPFSPAPFRCSKVTAVASLSLVCTLQTPWEVWEKFHREGLQKKDITDHSGQLEPPLTPKLWQFGYYLIYLKVILGRKVEVTRSVQHSQGGVNWLLWDLWGHVWISVQVSGDTLSRLDMVRVFRMLQFGQKNIFQNQFLPTTPFWKHTGIIGEREQLIVQRYKVN